MAARPTYSTDAMRNPDREPVPAPPARATTPPSFGTTPRVNPPDDPLALRPRPMARRLGVCERTLFDWTQKYLIPHLRVGTGRRKTVLYPVREVEAWLARHAGAANGGDA